MEPNEIELADLQEMALEASTARASSYAQASRSDATHRAYNSDWRHFQEWCQKNAVGFLPASPPTVGAYLATLADAGLKAATIQRRVSAIAIFHKSAALTDPTKSDAIRAVMQGIRRQLGTRAIRKTALITHDLSRLIQVIPNSLIGLRDRAILLLGFAGAFRRSELVALDVEDVESREDGLKIMLRRSKTDKVGAGTEIAVVRGDAMCPCAAVERWMNRLPSSTGPLFVRVRRRGHLTIDRLSAQGVAEVVKKYAERAGLDPDLYAGHSLRAGFATQAISNGVPDQIVMKQTRHKSNAVFQTYVRPTRLFKDNASGKVGL